MILSSTAGQKDLPRYFKQVFDIAGRIQNGRIDFTIPDGRVFRVDSKRPGPVAVLEIHDNDVFARLIREGQLGFCDA